MNTVSGDRKVSAIDSPAGSTCRQIAEQDLTQDFAARIAGVTEQCNGLLRRRAAFRTVRVPLVAIALEISVASLFREENHGEDRRFPLPA